MAAGTWTFTNTGRTSLITGVFDIDSDTWKMALFVETSNLALATTTSYANLTGEVANAYGYTTGGNSIALTVAGTSPVTIDITTDPVWTATGTLSAYYAAIYEVGGNVLCHCLLNATPATVTVSSGNTLTVAAHASGVFTLA